MWKAEDDVLHERLAEWEDKMEVEYDKQQEMLAEIEELQGKLKEWEWKWERATGQVGSSSDEDEENEDEETQEAGDQEAQDTEMTFQDADGTEWEIVRI
jgi:chromosome segregation ATPase